eukprot:2908745-Rhodomonas_salina.5
MHHASSTSTHHPPPSIIHPSSSPLYSDGGPQNDGGDMSLNPDHWRFARLIKPLRFLRILRVYRAMKR